MSKEPEDFKGTYTVGKLLDYIEKHKIPRDGLVLIQRIEDQYFEGIDISGMIGDLGDGKYGPLPEGSRATGWGVVKRPDNFYYWKKESIKNMRNNPDDYDFDVEEHIVTIEKELEEGKYMNEYHPIHSPVGYDEYKHLYLNAHY